VEAPDRAAEEPFIFSLLGLLMRRYSISPTGFYYFSPGVDREERDMNLSDASGSFVIGRPPSSFRAPAMASGSLHASILLV